MLLRLLEQDSQTSWYFANVNVSAYKYDLRTEIKMKIKLQKFIHLHKVYKVNHQI